MAGWTCRSCDGENPEGTRFCGHCGAPIVAPEVSEEHLRGVVAGRIGERLAEGRGASPYERRLITALFADVSGFTTLADRLDPEELLEVIDPVIAGLSSVVVTYEGYIEKFAGDALLALFGAPVAHEDDAERALYCALEMQRELARLVKDLPHEAELTLHVGVNSGHGIGRIIGSEARTDYAVLGDSVILAQRLESAAPPGETYVSQLTYELTGHRFNFEPVGELILKGKTEPVFAWRLLGERSKPLPKRGFSQPLIGREDELSTLAAVLDGVARGRGGGGGVAVTGDAGIGKSRLTEEAKARAEAQGLRWLEARCLSYGGALPYWPYADLLRSAAGIKGDDAPERASALLAQAFADVPERVAYFARLLGLPGDSNVSELEPEEFKRRLHQAFAEWLTDLAGAQPTVLSLEDVHWADASTLELTRQLVGLSRGTDLMLYLIGRPEATESLRELAPHAVRIELGPLGESQVDAVIESILEGSPPPQLGRIVRQHTGGNPFFVQELVRSLQETNVLVPHNGVWQMRPGWEPSELPPTLEGVLAARIDLLPLAVADTLHTASVIGRRLRIPLLQAITTEVPDLEPTLGELVRGGFLDRIQEQGEEALAFHHALVQDVAYGQLLRSRRRELHLRVADAAESLYGAGDDTVDLLARHLYLGEAGERAVPYLLRAGARAKGLFANDEAIAHLRRALELVPADTEVQLQLGDLHELVGDYDEALRLFRNVRAAGDDLRASRGLALVHRLRGEYADALAVVDDAIQREENKSQDLTPLWLEAGWALAVAGHFAQAIDVLNVGLETSQGQRDAVVERLLIVLSRAEMLEGQLEDAVKHALEARSIGEERGDVRGVTTVLRVLGDAYRLMGKLDEAAEILRQGLAQAEKIGSAEEMGGCLLNLGLVELERGDYAAAEAANRRAIDEFERTRNGSGRAAGYSNLAWTLAHAGDYDQALEYCRQSMEYARAIGHTMTVAETLDTMSFIGLRTGAYGDAAVHAEDAASIFLELRMPPKAAEALGRAAEAWEKEGNEERARISLARARSLSSEVAV
jgi:class 3 adenylate cyclase/tetratricopeptide (TPR) repeat protein